MNACRRAVLLFTLALFCQPLLAQEKEAPVVKPREGKREVIELFNGRDLTGWKGHEKYWSVQGSEIVGKNTEPIKVSTYLLTERNFSDFRLTFDFKLAESEMHSGIALWGRIAPEQGDPYTYAGHLVMFPSNYGFFDLYGRRGIHQNANIAKPLGKQHDWNRMEILAQGNRIRFALNGTLVSDWREPEPDRIREAPIGLQLHSNTVPQEVRFKNLRLEAFPEDKLITLADRVASDAAKDARMYRLYIGTYTGPKSKGIYQLEFDATTGKLGQPQLAAETQSPSFLAIHPSGKYIYAVNEVAEFQGAKNAGGVTALAVESGDGRLRVLNQQSSRGAAPCHIVVDSAGKNVLVANYTGGSCGVLPIEADGKLGPMSSFVQHTGSSVDPRRQTAPHAHSINLDKANRYAFVADLGLDQVLIYRYDGKLTPNDPPHAKVAPGAGPRHFAFHPSGKYAYVINEITKTVTALRYDASAGRLTEEQTISTVPAGTQGGSTAEVVVHPSGKFLYGSNRGHNSIAVFQIDESTGQLTAAGHQGEGVQTPRNFTIEPGGRFLLVANQAGDSLLVFSINQQTGALTPTDNRAEVGTPVCIRMLPL